jgi:hypothetical protein
VKKVKHTSQDEPHQFSYHNSVNESVDFKSQSQQITIDASDAQSAYSFSPCATVIHLVGSPRGGRDPETGPTTNVEQGQPQPWPLVHKGYWKLIPKFDIFQSITFLCALIEKKGLVRTNDYIVT